MKLRSLLVIVAMTLSAGAARADLVELPGLAPGATEWSMFVINNPKKITPARALAEMTTLLAPLGRKPCFLIGDRGAPVSCGDGAVRISVGHAYSYNLQLSFPTVLSELRDLDPKLYKGVKFPDGVRQAWAVNFLPPPTDGVTPCTGACNVVGPLTFSFSAPVARFSVVLDNGNTIPLVDAVRVTVNGQTLVRPLPLGLTTIAVEDIDPTTGDSLPIDSVLVELEGGQSQATIFDRMSYEPL